MFFAYVMVTFYIEQFFVLFYVSKVQRGRDHQWFIDWLKKSYLNFGLLVHREANDYAFHRL